MTRRLHQTLLAISTVVCVTAAALGLVSFLHVSGVHYSWRGASWELTCRGGVLWIDNQPQRNLEISETQDREFHNQRLWEAEHDRLRADMESAPYGPAYTAARLRMDAWEHEHGIRWPKKDAVADSPLVEHRIQLIWVAVPAAIVMLWSHRRPSAAGSKSAGAFTTYGALALQLLPVAACVAIAGLWIQSYRHPAFLCFYGSKSIYTATVVRGKVAFGFPLATDPAKLAAAQATAFRVRNDDLQWIVRPNVFRPQLNGKQKPMVGIETEVRKDTATASLEASPDEAEATCAMLDALRDPKRYLAAHAFLAELQSQQRFRRSPQFPMGVRIGRITYANSRYADLNIALTPAQRAVKKDTDMQSPNVMPGQFGTIAMKWHLAFDHQSKPFSLAYVTPLLLFPIYWFTSIWRRRLQRKPNHCRSCGYNLTGNVSGICPECGAAVTTPKKDAVPGVTV